MSHKIISRVFATFVLTLAGCAKSSQESTAASPPAQQHDPHQKLTALSAQLREVESLLQHYNECTLSHPVEECTALAAALNAANLGSLR